MGLRIVSDLDEWHRWQRRRHLARAVKHRLVGARDAGDAHATVIHGSADADIVVLVDATHASMANAVLAPLGHLDPARVITVLAPGVHLDVAGTARPVPIDELGSHLGTGRALLGCGEYTAIGAAAWRWARSSGIPTFVSQHGALTPFAPPLPQGSTLLAWSDADGEFWRSGRADVEHVSVGSQLLWAVQSHGTSVRQPGSRLVYLGQGHAAELPRRKLVEGVLTVCRQQGAIYRPHPSERDRLSRMTHDLYGRVGITVDTSDTPLAELDDPVVSVFSTGVLEAAVRGRDAWVDFPRPPSWLGEFWERYGMQRLGQPPTSPPVLPVESPARRIAEIVGA